MATSKNNNRARRVQRIIVAGPVLLLTLVVVVLLALGHISQTRPENLGVHDGRLAPLAPTPNGVSSQSPVPAQFIEPLRYTQSAVEAMASLKEVLRHQPRATIIRATDRYLQVEFRSRFFRLVDDVEFIIEEKVIQVRSAARVGRSDLGVNRERIEFIRIRFTELQP